MLKNLSPPMKILGGIGIIVFLVVFVFVFKIVYSSIYQSIHNREVENTFAEYGINPDELDDETREMLIQRHQEGEKEGKDVETIKQEITDDLIDQISQDEIDTITEERTKEIADQILGASTDEIPDYECDIEPWIREFDYESYYEGPLIDAHVHIPTSSKTVSEVAIASGFEDMPYLGDITPDYITCLFDSEGITKTFGFFVIPNLALSSSTEDVQQYVDNHQSKIVPFFMPPLPLHALNPSPEEVRNIIEQNPGLFKGYGEFKFAFDMGVPDALPDDKNSLEIYQIADDNNLIVMMHPKYDQDAEIESVLENYPNVNFLLHGMVHSEQEITWLVDTMTRYDNLYYSLDADLNSIYGFEPEHDILGPTKEEAIAWMRNNFDDQINIKLDKWGDAIHQHPDRFVWGSDRWFTWHYDYEVGGLIEEFGRSYIGQLDPEVQEQFAYKNAEALLE